MEVSYLDRVKTAVNEYAAKQSKEAPKMKLLSLSKVDQSMSLQIGSEKFELTAPNDNDAVFFLLSPSWASDINSKMMCGLKDFEKFANELVSMTNKRLKKKEEKEKREREENLALSTSSLGNSGGYSYGESDGEGEDYDDYGDAEDLQVSVGGHFMPSQLKRLHEVVAQIKAHYGEDCVKLVEDLGYLRITFTLTALHTDPKLMGFLHIEEDRKVLFDFDFKGSVWDVPNSVQVGQLKVDKDKTDHAACQWLSDICWHGINSWKRNEKGKLEDFAKAMELETWSFKMEEDGREKLAKQKSSSLKSTAPAPVQEEHHSWSSKLTGLGKKFFGSSAREVVEPTYQPENKAETANQPESEAKKHKEGVDVGEKELDELVAMGFDIFHSYSSLKESKNDMSEAVNFLFANKDSMPEVPAGSHDSLAFLVSNGHTRVACVDALLEADFDRNNAAKILKGEKIEESTPASSKTASVPSSKDEDSNFFLVFLRFLSERLRHYTRYCVSCHAPHNCATMDGVVCAEPLCVFRWEELHLGDLIPTSQCCFEDCGHTDLGAKAMAYFGEPVSVIAKRYDMPVQTILEMVFHKFLPGPEMKKFLQAVTQIPGKKKIENVLNPQLCARFEHRFKEMKEQGIDVTPEVAYHGTAEKNVESILQTGFLLNKLASGTGDKVCLFPRSLFPVFFKRSF